jgi:hypothetical protein
MHTPIAPASRQLRPTHWSRYLDAIFLTVWLVFWVVGEVAALALLVGMVASGLSATLGRPAWLASWAPPTDGSVTLFLAFLLFWLALWTVGGIAAITHLLRNVSGEDDITASTTGIILTRRAGPFKRRREIPRASIRRIRIQLKGNAVVADTDGGTVTISELGDADQRRSLQAWLLSQLGLPDEAQAARRERERPPAQRDVNTEDNELIVTHPTRRARILRMRVILGVAILMSLGWLGALRRGFMTPVEFWAALATLLVAASSLWLLTSRTEWAIRSGRMSIRQRIAHWTLREHDFPALSTLAIEHHLDSDGDDRYALVIVHGSHKRVLDRSLYDQFELLALGEWLSARTGFNFKR